MDNLKEERERGVTIDLAYKKLMTPKRQITIILLSMLEQNILKSQMKKVIERNMLLLLDQL